MHTRPRIVLAGASAAALLMSLAACSGSDDDSSTPEATPQQMLVDRTADGLKDGGSVHVVSEFTNGTGEGDSVYGGDSYRALMELEIPAIGTITAIMDDEMTYMNIPGQTPKGKFGEFPPDNVFSSVLRLPTFNPDAMVEVFEAATSVEEVGSEDVDGISTDHYKVTVASADALKAQDIVVEDVQPELVYDVYLDEDDHLVQVVYDIIGQHVEMDMSDWGGDVTVEVPSEDQIIVTELN